MYSGLLPHMLRGSFIKSLLFCESHVHICFIPQAACVPTGVYGLFQVATVFLLTATFISNHTDSRLEGHTHVFQLFSLLFCGPSLSLFSLHVLPSSCCLLLLLAIITLLLVVVIVIIMLLLPITAILSLLWPCWLVALPLHISPGTYCSLSIFIIIFIPPASKPYYFIPWQSTVTRPLALFLSSLFICITWDHMLHLWPALFIFFKYLSLASHIKF